MIAALYVETGGHYFGVEGVDPWDINRDARNYEGPWPVVAHPPCHLWVNFAALNFKRYGGEHNRPGNDGGCFGSALNSVRRWFGVLEHPAHSNAWKHFSLPAPKGMGWNKVSDREWVCEVWQSAYGHKARKRTWLYYVGDVPPADLDWSRNPGVAQCGWFVYKSQCCAKRGRKMHFEALIPWLIVSFMFGPASMYWAWRGRAKRYEDTLRLARGLIDMNRADYALHHIKEALERR